MSPDPKILTGTCQCPKFGTTSSTLSSSRTLWVISQKKYEFTTQKKISNKKHGCSNIRLPNFMVSHNSLGTEKKRQVQVCTLLVIFFPFPHDWIGSWKFAFVHKATCNYYSLLPWFLGVPRRITETKVCVNVVEVCMAACKRRFDSRESMHCRMQLACFPLWKHAWLAHSLIARTEDNYYWSLRSPDDARFILEEKCKTLMRLRIEEGGSSTLLSNKPSYCHFSYYVLFTPSENH